MNDCHEFKKLNTGPGIFENTVDACIIITCCKHNNFYREQSIYEKLKKHNFHSNTYILFNKGYKSCNMKPNIKKPAHDLTRSLYTVFKNFEQFDRILVLEDDYIVNELFVLENHVDNIEKFVKTNPFDIYSLGSQSDFSSDFFSKHKRCNFLVYSQSMIYSKMYMKKFIDYYENVTHEFIVDSWFNSNPMFLVYKYYLPLICQTFPDTENKSESWHDSKITSFFHNYELHLLDLEKRINPGWIVMYIIPYLVHFLFIFILVKILLI